MKRPAPCHPERPYHARDLCLRCYMHQWTQNNRERKRAKERERYARNAEKMRAASLERYFKYREKYNEIRRLRRAANRDAVNAKRRAKYAEDPEHFLVHVRAWRKADVEHTRWLARRRYAEKKKAKTCQKNQP
jgi:hypothetical protein